MPSFRISVFSHTGPKEASVRIGRTKMLPSWEVDFGNGYCYLLVHFRGKWGALEGEGYSTPTRGVVSKLAAAIMTYQASETDIYQRLVRAEDKRISWTVPHPINRDRKNPPRPEIHDPVIVGAVLTQRP
ncbi:hypothetical protein GCM10023184_17780 [Flaviaesturariibacter amylovorans]|uniref:Uncharacterized protein n=1 Tax=Flaviaesturariibacter amylovorans TaxID=1084520 RepID=A0ABP8GPT2_9BACT